MTLAPTAKCGHDSLLVRILETVPEVVVMVSCDLCGQHRLGTEERGIVFSGEPVPVILALWKCREEGA